MKDFYQIDEIGKMEYLKHLHCYTSTNEFSLKGYSITIGINSTDENEAKNLHTYIKLKLINIPSFDRKAKDKLKELYNPSQKELEEIKVNHIDFYTNKDFELFYNLPENAAIEYLSVKFSEGGFIIDSGGGNY